MSVRRTQGISPTSPAESSCSAEIVHSSTTRQSTCRRGGPPLLPLSPPTPKRTRRALVALWVQDEHKNFGHDSTIQIDEQSVAGSLFGQPGVGESGNLQHEEA